MLQQKTPDINIVIVVPTTLLQEQWIDSLKEFNCYNDNITVLVIKSAIKNSIQCDLLILDEVHRYPADTFSKVFETIKYKMILCLTATFERIDGKHVLINRYAPVIDQITLQECLVNQWVSTYKEYAVLVEPLDIEIYQNLTKEFTSHFEFFDFDFGLLMSMVGPKGWFKRQQYAKQIDPNNYKETLSQVTYHAVNAFKAIQKRKKYIYNHPEKFRLAEEIIAARPNEKIITFSANVKAAESFKNGFIYTGKESKKNNRITLEKFNQLPNGILNVVKLADEGLNCPDLSVGIMLGINSSKTKHTQTRGRVIRYHEGKQAEFFTLILKDTVEVEWWRRSVGDSPCELIDEQNLMKVLNHEPYTTLNKDTLKEFMFNI